MNERTSMKLLAQAILDTSSQSEAAPARPAGPAAP
jgi:hypothetical protein